ncbi:MAG: hypothetical protein M0Z85_02615, partial [Gammaproteobacteria bacterium]|nr:hypothetical protein [Gammaproteobacteria bacterium]
MTKFLGEGKPQTISRVLLEKGAISDKCDNAVALDPVGGPPDSADVGVIEVLFVGGMGLGL